MLSTRMIIDHRILSMNSKRAGPCAVMAAFAVAATGMSVMPNSAISRFRPWLSESRNIGERQLAAVDMHAAELGTTVQGRKHLAGIEQALGVEGAFDPLLGVEIDLAEHLAHQIALLDADAVLPGQNAAERDACPQDVGAEGLRALHLAGLVGIVEDQRMQITVTGMEHVGDP